MRARVAASEGIWGWRAVNAASVLVYLFLFAPIMVTMLLSFNASQFGGFPMTGFSFRWFGVLLQNDIVLAAVRRSLILGALTSVICTVLGILAAMALVRYEFLGKEWVNTLLVAPVLIPETVLAVGLLLFIRWLHAPRTFLVANVTARPTNDPETIRRQLVEQVTGRVRWRESIDWLAGEGGVTRFAEAGSGKVLTGMVKRIAPDAEGLALGAPADLEAFAKSL